LGSIKWDGILGEETTGFVEANPEEAFWSDCASLALGRTKRHAKQSKPARAKTRKIEIGEKANEEINLLFRSPTSCDDRLCY